MDENRRLDTLGSKTVLLMARHKNISIFVPGSPSPKSYGGETIWFR